MDRKILRWNIEKLINVYKPSIGFPEFQREPTVWDLEKKQKLIDSILRKFDIAPIYLYKKDNDTFECIDGKQRINAIYSFTGKNADDKDFNNKFKIKIFNEIYTETDKSLLSLGGKTYQELLDGIGKHQEYRKAIDIFHNYNLNIIQLSSDIEDEGRNEQELSLQFIRLNLLSALNAGEKLHAMSGDMHDFIFKKLFSDVPGKEKKQHPYFKGIKVPYKRYAREQIAAQIALNYFSFMTANTFSRSRYLDLQYFFKRKFHFSEDDKRLTKEIEDILDKIVEYFGDTLEIIANRAIAVTTFMFVVELIFDKEGKKIDEEKAKKILPEFKNFLVALVETLKWQSKLYREAMQNPQYREIFTNFQNYITNAAGESYALKGRHEFIKKYFEHYLKYKEILGDSDYKKATSKSAEAERSNVVIKQIKIPEG